MKGQVMGAMVAGGASKYINFIINVLGFAVVYSASLQSSAEDTDLTYRLKEGANFKTSTFDFQDRWEGGAKGWFAPGARGLRGLKK